MSLSGHHFGMEVEHALTRVRICILIFRYSDLNM